MADIIDYEQMKRKIINKRSVDEHSDSQAVMSEEDILDFSEDLVFELSEILDELKIEYKGNHDTKKDFYMVYIALVSLLSRATGQESETNIASDEMFKSFFGEKDPKELHLFDIF